MAAAQMGRLMDVPLTVSEYEGLLECQRLLLCLQDAGVDNWSGYDYAMQLYNEYYGEDAGNA